LLNYLESNQRCSISFDSQIEDIDIDVFEQLLEKNYNMYELNFATVYTIPARLILLLNENINVLNKKIEMTVHKNRLSKYMHQLGFKVNFVSALNKMQVSNVNQNIIAIGGSANSSEKIINILSNIDTNRFTIFIIQHIDAKSKRVFDRVLSGYVDAKVLYAEDGMKVYLSCIYIAPPDKHMRVIDGVIYLDETKPVNYSRPSISVSFESLSKEYLDRLVLILECGYGQDGVSSLAQAKKLGSSVIIQDPSSCEAKVIPTTAINSSAYNCILDVESIAEFLNLMVMEFKSDYELLNYFFDEIYNKYEYDYRSYQREYVKRRVETFMIKHNIQKIKKAVILILFNKTAFKSLFLDLSVNVTEFFREIPSLTRIKEILQDEYKNNLKIKVWSAGCSSGKEVYSMGILLDKIGLIDKSLIYATDFNPVVIEEAKNAIYPMSHFNKAKQKFSELSLEGSLDDEFEIYEKFVKIKDSVKKNILFFTHNLEKDSVFNEFDIIECKNVLIYFNDELKSRIIYLLYNSLKFGGYLSLGSSELLPMEFDDMFERFDEKYKIYKKVA